MCLLNSLLLYMCPPPAIKERVCLEAPHATTYVSASYYICVRLLLHVSSYYYICVLILLYMCPHARLCVLILVYMCPHARLCVLILVYSACLEAPQNVTYIVV